MLYTKAQDSSFTHIFFQEQSSDEEDNFQPQTKLERRYSNLAFINFIIIFENNISKTK